MASDLIRVLDLIDAGDIFSETCSATDLVLAFRLAEGSTDHLLDMFLYRS